MAHYPTTIILSSIRELIRGKLLSYDSQRPRTPSAFIHVLDNDSLLKIFCLYRPALLDDQEDAVEILGGRKWDDERWWYRLVQVCRRWRYLVLESASFLGLSLLCKYGTPVADMLAHSPRLPLIIDYCDLYDYITASDELGIAFALEHRDRVRRIRIMQPVHIVQRIINALHGEFPNLEYLFIERHAFYMPSTESNMMVDIPGTFRAPRLRYLVVMGYYIPIGSRLLFTTMGNLVTLSLNFEMPSVYFHPNPLREQISPETSANTLGPYFSSGNVDDLLLRRAVRRRITPYLRRFGIQSANAYLEALLPRVTIRFLERLQLYFLDQLKNYFILPRRLFMSSADNVWLKTVRLTFLKDDLQVDAYTDDTVIKAYQFGMSQGGRHLDWQLTCVTKFFHTFRTVFSPVEHLILRHDGHLTPPEWNNEAGPTQWRELFTVFGNLKALYMDQGFTGQLSRSLQPDEGESPTDLLPELREIGYTTSDDSDNAFFAEFVHARQNAGRSVAVLQAVIRR